MSDDVTLEIENNPDLLREYGLATACLASADYLLGEIILQADKNLSPETVHNNMTLGPKILKIKSLGRLVSHFDDLDSLLEDRNKLAHGLMGGINGLYSILHRQKITNIDIPYLQGVVKRAKEILPKIYNEMTTFMVLP